MHGYYYLHSVTKDLVFKRFEPGGDSGFVPDFVQRVWPIDTTDRIDAWTVILEGLALGAKIERVKELVDKWSLTFDDSVQMLKRIAGPSKLMQDGIILYATKILGMGKEPYWDKVRSAW
jgi:hypothetical protein